VVISVNVSILGNSKLCGTRARASVPRDLLRRRGKKPGVRGGLLSRQLNCRVWWWSGE